MVMIEEFSETIAAQEAQEYLLSLGIRATLAVDPLTSRAPALGVIAELGLFVEDAHGERALQALRSRGTRTNRAAS